MRHFFEVKEEASQEAIDAYLYYENKQEGLGERFFKRIENTYKRIDILPEGYQKIHKHFRAAKVKNFSLAGYLRNSREKIIIYYIFSI